MGHTVTATVTPARLRPGQWQAGLETSLLDLICPMILSMHIWNLGTPKIHI